MVRVAVEQSQLDVRGLSTLIDLSILTFLVSGAPTVLLQYYDMMSNSGAVILIPALAGPVLVSAAFVSTREASSTIGFGIRLWFLLSMANVGLMSVSYVVLVALFGLS